MEKAKPVYRHCTSDCRELNEQFSRDIQAFFFIKTNEDVKKKGRKSHAIKNQNSRICMDELSQDCSKAPQKNNEMQTKKSRIFIQGNNFF